MSSSSAGYAVSPTRLRAAALAMSSAAGWVPGSWAVAHRAWPHQLLRCVLFHQISDEASPFTEGLDVRVTVDQFAARLDLLSRRYTVVDLDEVLGGLPNASSRRPPLLVTFDDAYAGVLSHAAPICAAEGVPSIFFVVGSLVGNGRLGVDNLVAYVVNTIGFAPLERAADRAFAAIPEVIHGYLPTLDVAARQEFERRVVNESGIDAADLATRAQLYVEQDALKSATTSGHMEFANHTWSHVHCGGLTDEELAVEIGGNAQWLGDLLQRPIRAFSYPYGARSDASVGARRAVADAGHAAVFYAGARPNLRIGSPHEYDRVTLGQGGDGETFRDLELQPLFREWQNRHGAAAARRTH